MTHNTRIKEQKIVTVDLPDATPVEVVVPRPRTTPPFAGSDFEGEKTNHLTEQEVGRKEGMGGLVGLSFNDTATGTFIAADVFVESVCKRRDVDPFREATALFPSGADPIDTDISVLDLLAGTTLVGRRLNDTALLNFLSKIPLNARESLVLLFRNDSGGAIIGELVADYDLGSNEQQLGSESIL